MRDENPQYYEDTISLFDYGFANFEKINISETETKYNIETSGSFYSDKDIFGSSKPILSLNKDDYIVLPKTAEFSDTMSSISYDTGNEAQVAVISYAYHDTFIGSVSVDLAINNESSYTFDTYEAAEDQTESDTEPSFVFINIFKVLLLVLAAAAFVGLILGIRYFFVNYTFSSRSTRSTWMLQRFKRHVPFKSASVLYSRRRRDVAAARKRQKINNRQRRRALRKNKRL
jgi:hypothetical protein